MAIIRNGDKVKTPIVASATDDYGLYLGPKGGFHKAGIQVKAPKWSFLFTSDDDGTPNLMNIIEYLFDESEDFNAVEAGADEFVQAYLVYKRRRETLSDAA